MTNDLIFKDAKIVAVSSRNIESAKEFASKSVFISSTISTYSMHPLITS